MDRHAYLMEFSASDRADFGLKEYVEQAPDQQVFSAAWSLENEVSRGGFARYFMSWDGDMANAAPAALEAIGVPEAAAVVRRALVSASSGPLPDDYDDREALVVALDDEVLGALAQLDTEMGALHDTIIDKLFDFVSARPDAFGPVVADV